MKKYTLWQFLGTIFGCALVFLSGIAIASWVKGTTFTIEWANMVAWFATWAK